MNNISVTTPVIAVIIPVHGRLPLLDRVLLRLQKHTIPLQVICVGHTKEEQQVCERNNTIFIATSPDTPLGEKWQRGIIYAKENLNPDYIMILGSSNMVSHNWCEKMIPFFDKNVGMVGKKDLWYLDIARNGGMRLFRWPGYVGSIENEPVGTGRLIPRHVAEDLNWELYDRSLHRGLDGSLTTNIKKAGYDIVCADTDVMGVRISTAFWKQTNKFDVLASFSRVEWVFGENVTAFVKQNFPEAMDIFVQH